MYRIIAPGAVFALALLVSACASVSIELPEDMGAGFDLDRVLSEIQDCDALSEAFLDVVSTAADQIDNLAGVSGGRIEPLELRDKVEAVSVSRYFALAEQIGCQRLQLQAQTIHRLRGLDPEGAAGQDLIDAVLEQVEQQP